MNIELLIRIVKKVFYKIIIVIINSVWWTGNIISPWYPRSGIKAP